MNQTIWVLLDTETNGLQAPIYAVEIGAQMMRGWKPEGPPFRRLLKYGELRLKAVIRRAEFSIPVTRREKLIRSRGLLLCSGTR